MSPQPVSPYLRRASLDGALCTVRCVITEGEIPNTKGEWLGIEWDDPNRGKHNGTYQGKRFFQCQSIKPTVASFIRPSRKFDAERTVLEAIRYKYGGGATGDSYPPEDVVIISGKVAEEIGFDKIAKEQGVFKDLKIVVLERLVICGLAARGSNSLRLKEASAELAATCPNILELDLSFNTIERWEDICDICAALPKLRTLRLNGLRLRLPVNWPGSVKRDVFPNLKALHLNETLLKPNDLPGIFGGAGNSNLPKLTSLWMSQNELDVFPVMTQELTQHPFVDELVLENNLFNSLDCLRGIISYFPNIKSISLQRNAIATIFEKSNQGNSIPDSMTFPVLESLSIPHNQVSSFIFVDQLARVLPSLSSLRISGNPLYESNQAEVPAEKASETNYYLTLARIKSLKVLNYSQITSREREEGEIYYLSVAERNIEASIATTDMANLLEEGSILQKIEALYPRYQPLCQKYDRESIIAQMSSGASLNSIIEDHTKPQHPAGSIAAHLISSTFYLAQSGAKNTTTPGSNDNTHSHPVPGNIPTSRIFSLVARWFKLAPLQFKLVYESNELDPVRDDLTTKSHLYNTNGQSAQERYRAWGDWDADEIVAKSISSTQSDMHDGDIDHSKSNDSDVVRDGTRWKRREVEILNGFRSWDDWMDPGASKARIRIEPFSPTTTVT